MQNDHVVEMLNKSKHSLFIRFNPHAREGRDHGATVPAGSQAISKPIHRIFCVDYVGHSPQDPNAGKLGVNGRLNGCISKMGVNGCSIG
jgi:hypothetical protein